MSASILLAEDDTSLRFVLSQALTKEGYGVRATTNAATLSKWAREGEGDLILTDVYLGEENVFDLLPSLHQARPNLPVIVMSAQSTVATALTAASAGAFDYLPKPFDLDALIATVRRALAGAPDAKSRAAASKAEKEERLPLIGRSPAMQEVYRVLARAGPSHLPVLIEGENGSGKERIARAMHEYARSGAFVTAALGGLSAARIEQEFLGPSGKLAQARGGTLFLEDVDELPPEGQTRLAGFLQNGLLNEARLVAATQKNLAQLVRAGGFRSDLFYLMAVVMIRVPPLRERGGDIADLARAFLVRAKREGMAEKTLDASAITRLESHDWPGNVRELENVLRRVLALHAGAVISARDIDHEIQVASRPAVAANSQGEAGLVFADLLEREFAAAPSGLPAPGLYERMVSELERPLIARALRATGGNQIRAAALLGINRNTLRKKIADLGLPTGRGG